MGRIPGVGYTLHRYPDSAGLGALNQGNFIPASRAKAAAAESQVRYYQVQKGDTLWDISRSFNVDLQTLTSINNLDRNSILRIGQTLKIPGSGQRLHVIRPGKPCGILPPAIM